MNTVNPPGNEIRAARILQEYFARNSIAAELYAREQDRPNVVARLRGGDGPSLLFLSHTDTVLADPAEWDRDPWSGDLVDGEVWGRGALDMKDQAAASAVAFASLVREGFEPSGDLSSSRSRTRRSAAQTATGSCGSWRPIRTRPAATTRSTRAAARGSCSAGHPSTCARPRRRCPRRSRARARAKRTCLDAGDRGQRVRQGGALRGRSRLLCAAAGADPEARGFLEAVLGEAPPVEEALARAHDVPFCRLSSSRSSR